MDVLLLSSVKPYQWLPSLYFFQSMPFVVVTLIATIMYQQNGMDNASATLLNSLITLPWVFKPLFAPWLESLSTKKRLTILTQAAISIVFIILTLSINQNYFLIISIIGLICLAFVSSLHDVVCDGLYLINLNSQEQKYYVAWRSFFYQMGRLVIKGGLLALIGQLALHYAINVWRVFFICLFVMGLLLTFYHWVKLPEIEVIRKQPKQDYFLIVKTLLTGSKLYPALFFIFIYNFSDAQMQKIIPLYLLASNGIHLSLAQVGEIYGISGSLFLMFGIFTSSLFLTRFPLSRYMKHVTFVLCISHLFFFLLTFYESNVYILYTSILINQFTLGLANGSYMGYLLYTANQSDYPMTTYTICTSIMAFSYAVFGAISGSIEQYFGYAHFFFYIFIADIFLVLMTNRLMKKYV